MHKTKTGQCLCGAVKLRVTLPNDYFDVCHCGMCRKWSGGPAIAVEVGTNMSIEGQDNVTIYDSSAWAQRSFCKSCGSHLFYRLKSGGYVNVPLGLLNDVDDLKFNSQIFVDKKPTNYSFSNHTKMLTEKEMMEMFGKN